MVKSTGASFSFAPLDTTVARKMDRLKRTDLVWSGRVVACIKA
jgi:hypothetical protein